VRELRTVGKKVLEDSKQLDGIPCDDRQLADLDGRAGTLEPFVTDERARFGQHRLHVDGIWLFGEALHPEHDLHLD